MWRSDRRRMVINASTPLVTLPRCAFIVRAPAPTLKASLSHWKLFTLQTLTRDAIHAIQHAKCVLFTRLEQHYLTSLCGCFSARVVPVDSENAQFSSTWTSSTPLGCQNACYSMCSLICGLCTYSSRSALYALSLKSTRDRIIPKLIAEDSAQLGPGGSANAKKGTLDVHRGGTSLFVEAVPLR